MLTVDDARLVAEQLVEPLAHRVAELLIERGLVPPPSRSLTVREVAEALQVSRDWVYEHADDLGAWRTGKGPKAHLRFDEQTIDVWKSQHQAATSPPASRPAPKRARARRSPVPDLIPFEE